MYGDRPLLGPGASPLGLRAPPFGLRTPNLGPGVQSLDPGVTPFGPRAPPLGPGAEVVDFIGGIVRRSPVPRSRGLAPRSQSPTVWCQIPAPRSRGNALRSQSPIARSRAKVVDLTGGIVRRSPAPRSRGNSMDMAAASVFSSRLNSITSEDDVPVNDVPSNQTTSTDVTSTLSPPPPKPFPLGSPAKPPTLVRVRPLAGGQATGTAIAAKENPGFVASFCTCMTSAQLTCMTSLLSPVEHNHISPA